MVEEEATLHLQDARDVRVVQLALQVRLFCLAQRAVGPS